MVKHFSEDSIGMKLQILVPQYEETDDVIKPLLDSIALQQQVDFSEVGVIICNDGSDVHLSEDFLNSYPFEVQYHLCEHKGVSATRNACLDRATADYVMFCDADDMFCNICGMWVLFREMNTEGFDSLVSCFVEETRMPDTKEPIFVNHDMDSTFVHGKVHRRQYLIDHNIRFNDALTIHEDSYFNILAQNCSQNVKYCQTPFYLWKWRGDSVCRHDPKYILKTYNNMLDSNSALIREFELRSMYDKAQFYTVFMIFDAYYTMNKPEWINQENQEYRYKTEKHFKEYFKKHKKLWDAVSMMDKMQISNGVRARSINEGMGMERLTVDEWLKHIGGLK